MEETLKIEGERQRESAEQLIGAEQRRRQAEVRLTIAEKRNIEAEQRLQQAEQAKLAAEKSKLEAEQRLQEAEQTKLAAEKSKLEAGQRLQEAEWRKLEAQRRQQESADRLHVSEDKLVLETQRRIEAEQLTRQTTQQLREAEQVARSLQTNALEQSDDVFWKVEKREIQLTHQELGRGAWAHVQVAMFRGSQVAAKCIHSEIISEYNRQMFVREMNIAATLRHPNLVQFMGATLEGEPMILTELMTTSLRATLERGLLKHAQITSIGTNVCLALNYMHLIRPDPILHRDVSSANVLLNPGPSNSWVAKLSDYGSANFIRKLKTAGPGNPTYAAPEASDPSKQTPKMDVFSFGVLLIEMATQQFPDRDACPLTTRIQRINLPTLPRLPSLIRQCINNTPAKRPNISDVLSQL